MVLITGADGFIGSHLTETLVRRGHRVRALAYYNSFNSWGWLDSLPADVLNEIEVITGDIRDPFGMKTAMQGIDTVFHLAALIAIPYSYHSPAAYVETNVNGTLNVLQAARELGTRRVLVTSTSEVYGTAQYVPIDEQHPRQPQSPYSATKIAADCLAESFYRSFELPVTIVRPFNTYGPRQSARAFIPTIITQLLDGASEIRLGDLTPTRDLLYVQDTCDAFIEIAKTDSLIGEDVNIATGREHTIGDVARTIIDQINPAAVILTDEQRLRPAKSEVFRLLGTHDKLTSHTGWQSAVSLEEGLVRTIDWFSRPEHRLGYKSGIYNV